MSNVFSGPKFGTLEEELAAVDKELDQLNSEGLSLLFCKIRHETDAANAQETFRRTQNDYERHCERERQLEALQSAIRDRIARRDGGDN